MAYVQGIVLLTLVTFSTSPLAATDYGASNNILALIHTDVNVSCIFKPIQTSFTVVWQWGNSNQIRHDSNNNLVTRNNRAVSIVQADGSTATLQINNISMDDAGEGKLSRYPSKEGTLESCTWKLNVQDGPFLTNLQTVKENEIESAECCVRFKERMNGVTYIWSIEELVLESVEYVLDNRDAYTVCSNSTFQAKRTHHGKTITCFVKNQFNASDCSDIEILHPARTWWGPEVNQDGILTTDEDGFVNITCISDGYPIPNVTLQHKNISEPNRWSDTLLTGLLSKREGNNLTWKFPYDLGTRNSTIVRCIAANEGRVTFLPVTVVVERETDPTVQLVSKTNLEVFLGDEFAISCMSDGSPRPDTYIQTKDEVGDWGIASVTSLNKERKNGSTHIMWEFKLKAVQNCDECSYRCYSNNSAGSSVSSDTLVIKTKDTFFQFVEEYVIIFAVLGLIVVVAFLLLIREVNLQRKVKSRDINRQFGIDSDTKHIDNVTFRIRDASSYAETFTEDHTTTNSTLTEENVIFKTKLKKGKTRQRWTGILKSSSGIRDKIVHISTCSENHNMKEVAQEWQSFTNKIRDISVHNSVVELIGIFTKLNVTYCLQEHLSGGTVRTFLETRFGHCFLHGNTEATVPTSFFRFALNITGGVAFLHSHRFVCPGITVGKLLLVQDETSCKLYDFYPLDYTRRKIDNELRKIKNRPIPFLHLAPEVFQCQDYSLKSDTWAVGVVLWEIFSYGAWPPTHENVRDGEDVQLKLKKPGNCPNELYEVIRNCWNFDQSSRTTLQQLEERLRETKTDSSLSARAMNIEDIYKLPTFQWHKEKETDENEIIYENQKSVLSEI